ncbi:MAG: sigma-70 family RNA polymerase sigma factor [Chloroflexota bacterium]
MTQTAGRQEASLLASAAAGDEIAFRRIIAAYHDDMRRVCMAIAADRAIAEDATQSAWVIAWKRLGDVHDEGHLRPWLVTVAVNEAKQLVRKRRRRAEVEVPADASGVPGGIDPATDVVDIDVREAMARLSPDDRALLALRYVAGFDSNELARAIGISPSGTRNRLERLLKRLREELDHG